MKFSKKIMLLAFTLAALCALFILASCEETHTHSFGEWTAVKEPTCIEEGEKKQSCSCGAENVEKIPMLENHVYAGGDCTFCGYECPHTDAADACSACGSAKATYTVKVVDGLGNVMPMTLVYIYRGTTQVGVNFTDSSGEVSFELLDGKHSFTVTAADPDLVYDADSCVLNAASREKTISLYDPLADKREIYGAFETDEQRYGYFVTGDKCYSISFGKDEPTYFVFRAERTGIYEFTVSSDTAVKLGYFGSPDYVLQYDVTKDEDRVNAYTVRIDVAPSNLAGDQREASQFLIGVVGDGVPGTGTLTVKWTAEHVMRPVDYPWQTYGGGLNPEFYCPENSAVPGFALTDFDITDPNLKIVFNEEDGFYHHMTKDGPVVLVKLDVPTKYLEAISKMAETQAFACYLYNSDGTYKEKLTFQEMLLKYINACSLANNGVGAYPLDEHLMKMIKDVGGAWGWFDLSSNTNIFADDASKVAAENAWMFALCYAEVKPAAHEITVRGENGEPLVGVTVAVTDDEGIVLAEAKTGLDGVAMLTFKHFSDCYAKFDAQVLMDYTVNDSDLKLNFPKTTITLTAVGQDGGENINGYDPAEKYAKYNWDIADIRVQINECSANEGFSSVYRRYLAGETSNTAVVDELIKKRNAFAEATAKVRVTYIYINDSAEDYAWGSAGESISKLIFSEGASAPDVFCDSLYDLTSVSLKACFLNILKTGEENNFSFNEDGFKKSEKSFGYSLELMDALSFSSLKHYILASEIFVDTVRGLNTVPVNVSLIEKAGNETAPTIADFHKLVTDGSWTFSSLISLSSSFAKTADPLTGFILDTETENAVSAILYSRSFEIFTRAENKDNGAYSIEILDTGMDFAELFADFESLTYAIGIEVSDKGHEYVRSRFSDGSLLFGGIVPIASLEHEEYKTVMADGIYPAPVPLSYEGENYRTQLDPRANLSAVNARSDNIAEVTAFLDCQTTSSEDVTDAYCRYTLLWGTLGASEESREVLKLLRSSYSPSYAKAYDAVTDFYFGSTDDSGLSWSMLFLSPETTSENAAQRFSENAPKRQKYMQILINKLSLL